ncbi:plastocyanin/azurin family copper-binding protein [Streptomyces sp. NPDC007901]|uniref:cupredoxin domain-containing protein n=1 Tax=Streptomyces sp. NPDC007901 TaxID=3364785 RepID=UPI0036F168BE
MPRLNTLHTLRILLAALLTTGVVAFLDPPAAQAAGHQAVMSGYAFSPRSLTITAGDTVTWTNEDQAPHDVKTTSGPESIHSPLLNKGGTWSHTFTTAGTYSYVCTVHPGMAAQLVVQPAAAPAPTTQPTTHGHTGPAPSSAHPTRVPSPNPSSAETHHSGMAAATATQNPSPTAAAAVPAASTQPDVTAPSDTSARRPLNPLLLLAGVVAGVAVLCLLLVGSRSAAGASRDNGMAPS